MRATVGVWGAQALMRRIPPFLFICVREPWERVKICLRPKVETVDYTSLQKGGTSPLSSYFFLSYLLSSPLDTFGPHAICPRHFVLLAFFTTTIQQDCKTNFERSCIGEIRAHKRLEMVSPYDSTLFSILCFSGHPLSYRS